MKKLLLTLSILVLVFSVACQEKIHDEVKISEKSEDSERAKMTEMAEMLEKALENSKIEKGSKTEPSEGMSLNDMAMSFGFTGEEMMSEIATIFYEDGSILHLGKKYSNMEDLMKDDEPSSYEKEQVIEAYENHPGYYNSPHLIVTERFLEKVKEKKQSK